MEGDRKKKDYRSLPKGSTPVMVIYLFSDEDDPRDQMVAVQSLEVLSRETMAQIVSSVMHFAKDGGVTWDQISKEYRSANFEGGSFETPKPVIIAPRGGDE